MSNEHLRQQFERNKERLEQAEAKERAAKSRWRYAFRAAAISFTLFIGGAALEAITKFFTDSIPPRLMASLCYMSDVLRSNEYP
jgi:hypothetical protein